MSKYMAFDAEAFANRDLLIEALKEMGFEQITVGTDLPLQGWDKRDNRVADVVIRRSDVKGMHLLGDIGFQKTAKGYVAVVDDMDLDYRLWGAISFAVCKRSITKQRRGKWRRS